MTRDLRDAWERHAGDWIAWTRTPGHDPWFWEWALPELLALVPAPGGTSVDLGSGEGRLARALRDRGHRVISVEAAPTLARAAAEHPDAAPVVRADAAHLPLPAAAVDLVTASYVLQDLDDLYGTVREVARVLTPRGTFLFVVPHPMDTVADGDYFTSRRTSDTLVRNGLAMTFESYHHPLSRYTAALAAAGLLVDRLREPMASDAYVASRPTGEKYRLRPAMLVVRCVRPGPAPGPLG